jgi:thiamine-phosphate pyrophosphorylase
MNYLTSPGVERALAAAQQWAIQLGSEIVQLTHLILALLEEEEGRAAQLVQRLGLEPAQLRQQLLALPPAPPAPPLDSLLACARDWSISQRQDTQLLTDDLLLAVLHTDAQFAATVSALGLDLNRLRHLSATATTTAATANSTTNTTATSAVEPAAMASQSTGAQGEIAVSVCTPAQPPATDASGNCGIVSAPFADNSHDLPESGSPAPRDSLNHASATATAAVGSASGRTDPPLIRLLDANCNRCREALRVLDDYCRFVLNDPALTEAIKQLRHNFAQWEQRLPLAARLAARNTPGDVGTTVYGSGEYIRHCCEHVAAVNVKRVQEALRSLEEYGKVFDPAWAAQAEQLRYRMYALEGELLGRLERGSRLWRAQLYWLLCVSATGPRWEWMVERAIAGGVQVVQLREKQWTDRLIWQSAQQLRRRCRDAGVLLIINDRPDIAQAVEADGVHLGQDDLPVSVARQLLGPKALIGCSTHTPEQITHAIQQGADYIGVGPIFPSPTKQFDHFPGLEFARQAATLATVPAFALGGITRENLPQVLATGIRRIAVSSLLSQADDPAPIARQLRAALEAAGASSGRG